MIEFAKKTGDYLSLSSADIKVIALTYQLEKELVGTGHLRCDPVQAKTIASRDKPAELIDKTPLAGFYMPPSKEELESKTKLTEEITVDHIPEKHKDDDSDEEKNKDLTDEFDNITLNTSEPDNINDVLVSLKEDVKSTENKTETAKSGNFFHLLCNRTNTIKFIFFRN